MYTSKAKKRKSEKAKKIAKVVCDIFSMYQAAVSASTTFTQILTSQNLFCHYVARGSSMIDCGIRDGNHLTIKMQDYAEDGDTVTATIDGW